MMPQYCDCCGLVFEGPGALCEGCEEDGDIFLSTLDPAGSDDGYEDGGTDNA